MYLSFVEKGKILIIRFRRFGKKESTFKRQYFSLTLPQEY
jgi:hypothetical protein